MAVNFVAPDTERANYQERARRPRPMPMRAYLRGLRSDLAGCDSWRRLQVFDGQHQSIATPRQGLDVPRIIGGISQGAPEGLYRRIDAVVEIDDRIIRPQPALDFLAGDDLAPTFKEHPQNLKYLFS